MGTGLLLAVGRPHQAAGFGPHARSRALHGRSVEAPRRPRLSEALPWALALALALLHPREPPWPRAACHAGGAAPRGTACGCEDSQGLILSFYVLPDCKFLNFLYSL